YQGAPDPVAATRSFFEAAAQVLSDTGYEDACPIATVALEVASTSQRLRKATADVFASWIADTATHLEAAGMSPAVAREVSITCFELVEGAFLLCRAWQSTEPLEVAGRRAVETVRQALAVARPERPPSAES